MITRDPDLLGADEVTVAGAPRTIVRRAGTDLRPIMRLEGLDTRAAIDALRNEPLLVPRPPLEEDEFWADDLIGCEIAGHGKVVRMLSYPSCEVLETEDGSMIPLVRDAIARIDLDGGRIELTQGFLGED